MLPTSIYWTDILVAELQVLSCIRETMWLPSTPVDVLVYFYFEHLHF